MFSLRIFLILICYQCIFYFNSKVIGDDNFGCPTVKTKQQWGGARTKKIEYQIIPVKYVIIHHTAGDECSTFSTCSSQVKNIQDYHMNTLEWYDIGYNFLIGNDGNVYEGGGWHKIGAHAYGWNSKSIGIAFMGNFENKLPSQNALNAAKKLLDCGVAKGELDKRYRLYGARQVIASIDPGLALYNEIQEWDNWSDNLAKK